MFAVQPQTVSLTTPGDDVVRTLTFANLGDDVSKCVLELDAADGAKHVLTFHRHGGLIDQQYVEREPDEEAKTDEGQDHETWAGGEKQPA